MSKITPISFPEDRHATASPTSSFPYAAINGGHAAGMAQGANGMSRMQQLEAMLHEAQGRAEIIEKEAYDKAYLAGEKAGMALGKKRGEQLLAALQESLQDAGDELAEIRHAFADAAMEVAEFVAVQIVGDALNNDRERLWEIARQAAASLPDASGLRIAVSPDDYELFKRLLESDPSMATLSSDASIASGSCRIISSQQDMLIDPLGAVRACLDQLRPALMQPASAAAGDHDGD